NAAPSSGTEGAPKLRLHLLAGIAAVAVLAAGLGATDHVARVMARHRLDAVILPVTRLKTRGLLLQEVALERPDLLPLYASSELVRHRTYRATEFFAGYPTGFAVFPVAALGLPPLIQAQNFAALGDRLRGHRLVLFVWAPGFVWPENAERRAAYAGNFSRLQATAAAVSPLPTALKEGLARRMLDYPETLKRDPLLRLTLHSLLGNDLPHRLLYTLLYPLNRFRIYCLESEDAARVLNELRDQRPLAQPPAPEAPIDWDRLERQAETLYRSQADQNPFGVGATWWRRFRRFLLRSRGTATDSGFQHRLDRSSTWTDLDLAAGILHTEGAQVLLLDVPLDGTFSNFTGVSPEARLSYYAKLRALATRYRTPVVDFANHDGDRYFLHDQDAHPSPKGWAYLDRAINAFYHDSLPDLPSRLSAGMPPPPFPDRPCRLREDALSPREGRPETPQACRRTGLGMGLEGVTSTTWSARDSNP
ncbi:MAG TPA: D-alanyl-lipoteichoic acid biosynthesis protein DltD, partial [Gemmatimonadales bacterium]|nr:D-alanyl-lipoteichoic acid biosynthesis protein DltD [Gemmatimonadales bacterium]